MINVILYLLYLIALIFAIYIISLVVDYNVLQIDLANKAPLLGAFGIIISAFIASFSVLKNIENTNKIEETKKSKKIKSLFQSLILISNKINVFEYSLQDIKDSSVNEKYKMNLHLHKLTIPYLLKIRDSIIKEDYSAYIEDENNYILLLESIDIIDNLSILLEFIEKNEILEHEQFREDANNSIPKLKDKCKVLIDYYRDKININKVKS